jgi:transketolase
VLPIAFRDRWFTPALLDDVLRHEGLTGEQMAETIMGELETGSIPGARYEHVAASL